MNRFHRLIRSPWLGALLVVLSCSRAGADDWDIEQWTSKGMQSRPAEERIAILKEGFARPDGRSQPPMKFRKTLFREETSQDVRLLLLDHTARKMADNWKALSQIENEWLVTDIRKDYEFLHKAVRLIVGYTEPHDAVIRRTASLLYMLTTSTPCPEIPPSGQKVSVTWQVVEGRRGRPVTRTVVMDAAQAKRARMLYEEALAKLNQVAGRDFKVGPDLRDELMTWWQRTGQGWVFVERRNWKRIQKNGYGAITSPDPAPVVISTWLGTKGTEWLSGGGFQPDGTVVVAGTCIGPQFEFAGIKTLVLGRDVTAPSASDAKPEINPYDRKGADKPVFGWMHSKATPFVVRLSADAKQIVSATRLPWASGSITACDVDNDGNIYITGATTTAAKTLREVSTDTADLASPKRFDKPKAASAYESAYLAKLSPGADRVLWIRFVSNPNRAPDAPVLRCLAEGGVEWEAADARWVGSDGQERARIDPTTAQAAPDTQRDYRVDAKQFLVGWEHHWPTGHEPWRCGAFQWRDLRGDDEVTMFNWPGPFVGDNGGLVSDSFPVGAAFDRKGDLILLGNSDGGNSMFLREPLDLLTMAPKMKGLGYGAGYAGPTKIWYLMRVSATTFRCIGGTAFNPGAGIAAYTDGVDDSMLLVVYGNVRLTEDHLCSGLPGGDQILVTDPACSVHRFSSPMLGCGAAQVGRARWGINSGKTNGRARALFVTGATARAEVWDWDFEVPRKNPIQAEFAGGALDGHLTIIDLGPARKGGN